MMKTRQAPVITQEEVVLNIIIEYLNENRTFRINEIIPYISARLAKTSTNMNTDGIKRNLNSLLKKRFIVEGSKLTKQTVLDTPNRKELYEFIKNNPGYYLNNIVDNVEISKYVIYFHLQVLLKFGLIKSEIIENHEIFFDSSLSFDDIIPFYYKSKKKSRLILNFLKENNIGHTKTKISSTLKIHSNTLSNYLDILEEHGFIYKEKISNYILYFIHEQK
ncbi:MAG: hypothetical protein ACFFBP_06405 [Promethearchaeota archaeon]